MKQIVITRPFPTEEEVRQAMNLVLEDREYELSLSAKFASLHQNALLLGPAPMRPISVFVHLRDLMRKGNVESITLEWPEST